jgi:hypothetical protein
MKTVISSAVAAVALISSATAIPAINQGPRELQRRWDAPPLPPCPQNNYAPFTYVGCFVEPNPETLQYNPNLVFSTMTVETCTATCKVNTPTLFQISKRLLRSDLVQWIQICWLDLFWKLPLRDNATANPGSRIRLRCSLQREPERNVRLQPTPFYLPRSHISCCRSLYYRLTVHTKRLLF